MTESKGRRKRPERKPFLLRVSPELMDNLQIWANQEFRSVNGHIEYLLQQAVNHRRRTDSDGGDET